MRGSGIASFCSLSSLLNPCVSIHAKLSRSYNCADYLVRTYSPYRNPCNSPGDISPAFYDLTQRRRFDKVLRSGVLSRRRALFPLGVVCSLPVSFTLGKLSMLVSIARGRVRIISRENSFFCRGIFFTIQRQSFVSIMQRTR